MSWKEPSICSSILCLERPLPPDRDAPGTSCSDLCRERPPGAEMEARGSARTCSHLTCTVTKKQKALPEPSTNELGFDNPLRVVCSVGGTHTVGCMLVRASLKDMDAKLLNTEECLYQLPTRTHNANSLLYRESRVGQAHLDIERNSPPPPPPPPMPMFVLLPPKPARRDILLLCSSKEPSRTSLYFQSTFRGEIQNENALFGFWFSLQRQKKEEGWRVFEMWEMGLCGGRVMLQPQDVLRAWLPRRGGWWRARFCTPN